MIFERISCCNKTPDCEITLFCLVSKTVNMGECTCDTRITKTIVSKENEDWRIEYSFDKVSDHLVLKTNDPNDLSYIKFPLTQFCPYTD